MWRSVSVLIVVASMLAFSSAAQASRDITSPQDVVQGVPNDGVNTSGNTSGWPAAEGPSNMVDNNVNTKFLHFKGEVEPTGIRITPAEGPTLVVGLTFSSANDSPERDPVTYQLSGSNDSIDGPYTLIAEGPIADFAGTTAWPRKTKTTTPITFANTVSYLHYQLTFPTIRTPTSANSMQIAEIELLTPTHEATVPNPADGAIDVDIASLEWVGGEMAVSHKVYLSKDQTIDDSDLVGETTATIQVVTLDPGTVYYWRVDAIEADGTVIQGAVWSFTTLPLVAHFPSPADGQRWVRLDTSLSWTVGKNAILHNIYLGTDAAALMPAAMMQLNPTFTPAAPLNPNTTYYWRVDEFTPGGVKAGPVWSFTTRDPSIGGAVAEYWTNRYLDGAPAVITTVPEVNFDWGSGTAPGVNSPDAAIPVDNFSCRWSAELQVPVTGTYTLYEASDDGARMFLNGVQVAAGWRDRGTTEDASAALDLVAGERYLLVMEMYENGGGSTAFLRWEGPGYAKDIIPPGALMPPQMAFSLSPRDGATGVSDMPVLSWLAGDTAVEFNVYFGADPNAVAAGDASVLLGRQAEKSLALTSALTWDAKYYWKVDAITADGTILPGIVSSFTVKNQAVIDDFEAYDVIPVQPSPAGLVGWWKFDGNYDDSSGNGRVGKPIGDGITFVDDPERGQVLHLPGTDNATPSIFVEIGSVGISGNMPRTIACWAKADNTSIPDWTLIFGFTGNAAGAGGNGSHFNIGSLGGPGGVGAHVWGWEETIFSDQQALSWHHYAMTYDGTTIRYYGDGKLMDTDVAKSNVRDISASADRVHVGSRVTQNSSFPGSVDDCRIYNYTLSHAEVASLAGAAPALTIPDVWKDAGGVASSIDLDIAHAGLKSMRIDLTGAGETSRIPPYADLAQGNAQAMSLWVRGNATSTAGGLYVKLNDTVVPLTADITVPWWQLCVVDFAGLNVQNVAGVALGIDGGAGSFSVDDILLHSTPPVVPVELWFEAEKADVLGAKWRVVDDPAAGGQRIGSENGDGNDNNTAPGPDWIAAYNFTAPAGVYKVALRVRRASDDSFWVRIVGATSQSHENPAQAGTGWVKFNGISAPTTGYEWDWVHSDDHSQAMVSWTLPVGACTLEIGKREDGVYLDAIMITDNLGLDETVLDKSPMPTNVPLGVPIQGGKVVTVTP